MQRIYNYGSLLQAYGLKKLIQSVDSSIDVSYLDYKPGEPLEVVSDESDSSFLRTINKVKEYSKGKAPLYSKLKFMNHKRTYAKKNYPYLGITDNLNYDTSVDYQFIGSDEVFNCVQGNVNVGFSKDLFGYNTEAKKLFSYAASFGNTTLQKLQVKEIKHDVAEMLKKFDALSVRDQNSADIVERLTGITPEIHVDPVLAFDYMNLENKIPKERQYKGKYLVVYGYSGRFTPEENELIKAYAKENNLKVLCFGGVQDCCDIYIDCSPFELLAYFRDADVIVTDTFHGSIFSIINNKQFCTVVRRSNGISYGNEEKLSYLIDMFGLNSQKVYSGEKIDLETKLNKKIDYNHVNRLINNERKKTRKFLEEILISGQL